MCFLLTADKTNSSIKQNSIHKHVYYVTAMRLGNANASATYHKQY